MIYPRTVKSGSVQVTIYAVKDYFQLAFYVDGKRKRETKSDEREALARAKEIAARIAKGEAETAPVTRDDAYVLRRARALLTEAGHTLEVDEAVRLFVSMWTTKHVEKPLSQVCTDYREWGSMTTGDDSKQTRHRAKYARDLKFRLNALCESFGKRPIQSVKWEELQQWIHARPARKDLQTQSERTRSNWFNMIRTVWNFAESRRYLPKGYDELPETNPYGGRTGARSFMLTNDLYALYNHYWREARFDMLCYLGVQAFAGLRVEEAKRLRWEDIGRGEELTHFTYITVNADAAKKGETRYVTINLALSAWLQYLWVNVAKPQGRIIEDNTADAIMRRTARKLTGKKWQHNQLRHTYLTNACVLRDDTHKVADEAGTSVGMLKTYYREHPDVAEAVDWFTPVDPDAKRSERPHDVDKAKLKAQLGW